VVCPTTPLEKRGGISRDREEPSEEEESRRARLLPVNISERYKKIQRAKQQEGIPIK
jgi:hypothetical protein